MLFVIPVSGNNKFLIPLYDHLIEPSPFFSFWWECDSKKKKKKLLKEIYS